VKIYLGGASKDDLRKAREIAPSHEYGNTWSPNELNVRNERWIGDNGAYSAWLNDERWDAKAWKGMLDKAYRNVGSGLPEPDFVVLPDKVGDAEATYRRSEKWLSEVPGGWSYYFAVQDGMRVKHACRFAHDLGAGGVFVGGTKSWKARNAETIVAEAHKQGLKAHIARPMLPKPHEAFDGNKGLRWCERIGADSVDTTTIARNASWRHLRDLEQQTEIGARTDP
jgi:hypothetical protein